MPASPPGCCQTSSVTIDLLSPATRGDHSARISVEMAERPVKPKALSSFVQELQSSGRSLASLPWRVTPRFPFALPQSSMKPS